MGTPGVTKYCQLGFLSPDVLGSELGYDLRMISFVGTKNLLSGSFNETLPYYGLLQFLYVPQQDADITAGSSEIFLSCCNLFQECFPPTLRIGQELMEREL